MEADQITGGKKFVQRNIFQKVKIFIWEKIISDYFHTEATADFCHCLADFSGTDDTGSFLIKVYAHETVQCKVVFTAFDICFMGVAVGGKGKCHGVFGNCFRRITWNTCHLDFASGSSFQINVVVSCTAH